MCSNKETTNRKHILPVCGYSRAKFSTENLVQLHSIQQFLRSRSSRQI